MNNNLDFLEILDEFPSGIIIIKKPTDNISIGNSKNKTINSNINSNYSIYYSNMYISKIFPKTFLLENNNTSSLYRLENEENYKLLENFFIECSHFKLFNIDKNNLSDKTLKDDILKSNENVITETYINEYYMILVKIKKINEFILININDYIEQKEMLNKKLIKSIEFDYFNTVNHEIKNPINFLYNFDFENNNYRTAIFLLKNCLKRFILISKIMFDKNLNNFMFSVLNLNYLFFKVFKKYKLLFDYKKIVFKNKNYDDKTNKNDNKSNNNNSDDDNSNSNNKESNKNDINNNNENNMFDFLNDFFFKCDEFYFKNLIKNLFYYFYLLLPEKSEVYLQHQYNFDNNINDYNKKLILIFYYENFGKNYTSFKSLNFNNNNEFLNIELNDTVKSLDFSKNIINDICQILNINIFFNNINDNNNSNENLYKNYIQNDHITEILVMEINNVIYNKNNILFDKKKYDFVKNEIDCAGINGKIIKKLNNNIEFKFTNYMENLPSSNNLKTISEINYNTNDNKIYNKSKFCDNNKETKNNNNINYLSTDNNISNSNNNLFNNNNYKDNNVIIVNYFSENSNKNDKNNNSLSNNCDNDNNQNRLFQIIKNSSHNSNNSVSSFNNSINSYNNSINNKIFESRNHTNVNNNNNTNINNNNNNNSNYKKINTINTFKNFGKLVNNLKEPIINNLKIQKKYDNKRLAINFQRINTVILRKKKLTKTRSLDLKYLTNKTKSQYSNYNNIKNNYNLINSNITNNKKNSYYPNLKNNSKKISSNFFSSFYNSKKKSKENSISNISSVDTKKKLIKNILVVDDEEYNQKTLKNLLKKSFKLNCEIDIAINGEDCLEKLKEKRYYMIFMDLYMPVMNGVEAMKNIQNNLNGKDNYKVIVVSAHSYESVKNELKDINIINKFVQKPLNKKKLEEILNEFYY